MKAIKVFNILNRIIGFSLTTQEDDSLIMFGLLLGSTNRINHAFRIGWGYDEELPLRPWPTACLTVTNSFEAPDFCISLLGFYFGWSDFRHSPITIGIKKEFQP